MRFTSFLSLCVIVLTLAMAPPAHARDNSFSTLWSQTTQAFEDNWRSITQWFNGLYERGEEGVEKGVKSAGEGVGKAKEWGEEKLNTAEQQATDKH